MDTKKIIGPLQMASLCVLVRMFALFAFSPAVNQIENGNTRFLGNVVGFLVSAAMWIPAYYIFKGKTDYNILDYGKSVSPNVGKITSVILYFATVSIAIVTVSQFDYFITTTIYPNSSKLLYVIILIGTGMYYTSKGLEPIGRVANIFFALFIISLFLILGMLAPKINLVSLSTPFYDGVMSIFKIGYNVAAQNTPILIVLLLKPNIKEEKAKSYFSYLAISFVIFEIILFLIVTVLGEYGGTKPFPVYSLVAVTQGTILKRYDSVYMFIWIFTALIRFSIFLFLSNKCAREFFPPKFKKHRTNITAIIILICTTITIFNITIFERIIRFAFSGVILISTGVVLPIILILMKKVKDKKKASAGDNYEK